MTTAIPHILLVEDDPAIATSLKVTFKREGWQLTWLDNVSEVLPTLENFYHNPEHHTPLSSIILDVGLPDGDGLQFCQHIRHSDSIGHLNELPIIFLTARSEEEDRILGLEMGADDYCAKPFSPKELVARIKAIWRRQTHFNHPINPSLTSENLEVEHFQLDCGEWQYHLQSYQLSWNNHKLDLSNTERKLLLFLLQNPTNVFNREQLLAVMSDHPDHRLARTIDSHIKSIRKHLYKVDPEKEVIYTHRSLGYGLCMP